MLEGEGLLCEASRLRSSRPLYSQSDCEGLCIDDYFAISKEARGTPLENSRACAKVQQALSAYQEQKILGSPEKDVLSSKAKVVGATVNASPEACKRGLVLVGAPIEKRLSLSFISLKLAALSHTTDVLHTCLLGGWVSAFMFRRPLMSLFAKAFTLVDATGVNASEPKMVGLTRAVATELTLAAVLIPFAASELNAEYMSRVLCTDASSSKGAVCSAEVPLEVNEVLWKSTKSKEAYSRLLSPVEVQLRRHADIEEKGEEVDRQEPTGPFRPIAYRFSFIELFAGSAKITKEMAARGWSVGPPIDLSFSPEYDISKHYVMSWISYLITECLIEAFCVEPPCTSFSIMRRPQLRSKTEPYGFDTNDRQTRMGTLLALRGLQCLALGDRAGVPGWLETPYSSRLKSLPPYEKIRSRETADFCRSDSCAFGSPHLKSFAFLSVLAPLAHACRRCSCSTKHLVVQGRFTKDSAMYTDGLAAALALVLDEAILKQRERKAFWDRIDTAGLENALVNQVAIEASWETEKAWTFKKPSHINIQECVSVLKHVVRCALSKGRSSSLGLSPVIARFGAVCVAAGLYFCLPFCPTRLNAADDPTRDVPIREGRESLSALSLSLMELYQLSKCRGLRRWAANWVRLTLLLTE